MARAHGARPVRSGVVALCLCALAAPVAAEPFPAVLELSALDGSNGFVINGVDAGDESGYSVSGAGDVNDDGVDDLLIGAPGAGESYVVFGGAGLGSSGTVRLSALDGGNGFVLNGIDAYDLSGSSVSAAGDVNSDGVDDLLIGAPAADRSRAPDRFGSSLADKSYVVFGGAGLGNSGTVELAALDGSNGFVLNGIGDDDQSGDSVSGAGDVNGDGVDDLVIGAPYADANGNRSAGASYVVFGRAEGDESIPIGGSFLRPVLFGIIIASPPGGENHKQAGP